MNDKELLVVDVQNDFIPGGDKVVPILNEYIPLFEEAGFPVIASRDWHPANSKHLKKEGGRWPAHCLKETPGAAFHPGLKLSGNAYIVFMRLVPERDGYTVFEGRTADEKNLDDLLKEKEIRGLL